MNFGKVESFVLIGGGKLMLYFAELAKKKNSI